MSEFPSGNGTMRAMALTGPGRIEQVALARPRAGAGEVVVEVEAVGICGSDLAVYHGKSLPPSHPWVMGHEGGGRIVAVGAGVDRSRIGERVVVEPNYYQAVGGGNPVWRSVGVNVPGMLAEYVAVPSDHAWTVGSDLEPQILVTLEPLAVAVAAVRRSGIARHRRALVVGVGSIGIALVDVLLCVGAHVSFTDPHADRGARAQACGAARHSEGDDRRYDYVFETAGVAGAFDQALVLTADGGTLVLTGLSTTPASVIPADIVRRRLTVLGSLTYEHPTDFATVISRARRVSCAVASHRYGFADADRAFARAADLDGKSWIQVAATLGGA